ncbi:tyrosine-type recombinase/integrase [Castellaniella ginsengisoli]|uniref:Tyrosine-type recombinase/integrase n=1 Tax=Castellaniella ginsengisoli TaxID=546114 RepID=A0AB39CG54_9BURK
MFAVLRRDGVPMGVPIERWVVTRYPKGRHWTHKELSAISSAWKGDIISDGDGLSGEVRCSADGSVSIAFRYGFKWEGKKRWFYAGAWPSVEMAEIRARRNQARDEVAQGINPNDRKTASRIERQRAIEETIRQAAQERIDSQTVQDLFDTWIVDGVARKDKNAELRRLFAKDVLPVIGNIELRRLSDKDIRSLLRKQMKRGVTRQAVIVFHDIRQMLAWAEKRQPWRRLLAGGNPADLVDIDKLLPADYEEERDRILSPAEIRELDRIFKRMEEDWLNAPDRRATSRPFAKKSQIALWLCLSTICRIGELLMARWEHVDLDAGIWFIPRENVKGQRGKKKEHFVFLSDFSKRQFQALHDLTGENPWCFPARNRRGEDTHVCLKSISKQVGDRQIQFKSRSRPLKGRAFDNALVLAGGANGAWTPHDLRRTGATMMQGLGVSLDVIDRCQNHLLPGRVRRVYLRHDYEAEKTEAWRLLGAKLDSILLDGNAALAERP